MRKPMLLPLLGLAGALLCAWCGDALAQQTVNDDFTQSSDNNSWKAFGGACLTAGDGTGSIPSCVGLSYYQGQVQYGGSKGYLGQSGAPASGNSEVPDPAGGGALRFTNGSNLGYSFLNGYKQSGAIISSGTPFASGSGLQVVFKTVTYFGNYGGSGGDGADGMSFLLMDGAYAPYDVGAFGGSLGYSCSNTNDDPTVRPDGTTRGYDGLAHGYLGLGIDEYGNFLNQGDNTATGYGYQPGRIGLRGAGSISWAQLNANYPAYYPSTLSASLQQQAVQNTCSSGYLWNYGNYVTQDDSPVLSPKQTSTPVADYAVIPNAYTVLSNLLPGKLIANEGAVTRSAATPITYNLKLTQNGLLSLYISYGGGNYLPVITKQSITASNGALPASFRFGFAGSDGGSSNVHEILCFQATPADVAGTSVGINEKEATKIASGTQAYLAYYYPATWTGRLTASNLLYNSTTQTLSIAAVANWDASCNLTGVGTNQTCPSTQASGPIAPQSPAYPGRNMLTYNGTQGVGFEWTSSTSGSAITSTQQNTLDQGDPAPITANRLNYLRGDRSNEVNTLGVGLYRARDGVLGDIVDSSPTWVGPPASPYAATWKDLLVTTDVMGENSGTQSYTQYLGVAQTRLNVVYTGANDGFVHGFRSGSFDANGNFVNNSLTPNDGAEVLAYMPAAVLNTIHNTVDSTQDFSNTLYSHNFFVDATPDADELFYGGSWHTWLVGGLGAGGPALYALDITDPTQFNESNAANLVKGEWNSGNISCVNVASCGQHMGNTYGVPVVRRLHDGKWGIIFGNGFGSATGDAGIFIMLIDPSNAAGVVSAIYYLGTGATGSNGIAYVAPADLDGDHITDYVYAGDLLGNIWRFDLTSASESAWAASSTPLFSTPAGEPITTKPLLAIVPPTSGPARVMVDFGTGRKIPQTNLNPATYATGTQYIYGIWDWNLSHWNSISSKQFASLTSAPTLNSSNLTTQTLTPTGSGALDVTNNPVCWSGSTTCTGGTSVNNKYGFQVALPNAGEQVIFNPLLYQNSFIVNTTIPAVNSPTSCQVNHDTGDTIAISVSTGGAVGFFKNTTDTSLAGAQTNGTGTPFIALAGGNTFLLTQSLGDGLANGPGGPINCPKGALYCTAQGNAVGPTGKRLTWVERR